MTNECVFSPCRKYRYSLIHRWERDLLREYHAKPLMVVACNPSVADENRLDKTLTRLRNFADSWGFDSFVMTNLWAFRTTWPAELKKAARNGIDPIGPLNDFTILQAAQYAEYILLAWGVNGSFRNRDKEVLALLAGYDLRRLTETKGGYPRHPLFLANGAQPLKIDAS